MQEFRTGELILFAEELLADLTVFLVDLPTDQQGSSSDKIEAQLSKLEVYTQRFADWRKNLPFPLEDSAQWPAIEQQHLKELSIVHEKLLELAASLREDTLQRRQKLSKKGQGLLAYVDSLPKSLSIFRSKKG